MAQKVSVGLQHTFTGDLASYYTSACTSGYSFISVDLFHPKSQWIARHTDNLSIAPAARSDLAFQKDGKSFVNCVVGKISASIDVDSDVHVLRAASETALEKELSWAAHLGIAAVSIRLVRQTNVNLARLITRFVREEYTPIQLKVQLLVTGSCRHDVGYAAYQQYLNWLWKNRGALELYEQQSRGLEDQLQEPLQPLRDNLSSGTYSVFEMDPYKYRAYEDAIHQALLHRSGRSKLLKCSGDVDSTLIAPEDSHRSDASEAVDAEALLVVMVLGAGRGPLVHATLNAAERARCRVRIYVVEKNPNALYTLQDRMTQEWAGLDVHLIRGDMRNIKVPEKADIFVSELLGSFGDNELSPECLDGAQPHLKDDGISIPCSYTSYLAPLHSLKFYGETKRSRDQSGFSSPHETPYVVGLTNYQLLADPQETFTFRHPKADLDEPNSRYVTHHFQIEQDSVVHGLAGYFEATLFNDITLSTHPARHSPDMVSWFPMVFPLDRPVHVTAGQRVTVHLWRVVSSHHVWYEWALSEPWPVRIHNSAGHAYKIAL
ncbi:unnamed protein product [Dicrocoelium dendriticum]|nr:unnamed protein product [Dicrocoelium dendriticum]